MDLNLPDTDGIKLSKYYRNDFLPKPATSKDVNEILECWITHQFIQSGKGDLA